jgi:hypothetical protein
MLSFAGISLVFVEFIPGHPKRSLNVAKKRIPMFVPGYGKSYALLSGTDGVDTVVIFVHGFGGKPTSTWRNFHGLVDEYAMDYSWWPKSDMYFYAYESLHTPIRRNAELLGGFVDVVLSRSLGDPPADNLKYKNLVFAGHSEGGVIIRRLILDRYEATKTAAQKKTNRKINATVRKDEIERMVKAEPVLSSYLRLFAPACMGTNFSSWAGFLTSWSHLVSALTASSLVRNELLSGSPILKTLQTGTELAHEEFPEVQSLYTRPLFGVPDQIVYSDSYKGEELLWDDGYDHFGVCKPNHAHKRPLEFVKV